MPARADEPAAEVVFLEPDGPVREEAPPTCRVVTNAEQLKTYTGWLDNESARRAFELYAAACAIAGKQSPSNAVRPTFYVLLIPEGNNAAIGFRIQTDTGVEEHLRQPFIKLAPEDWAFATTLLHETGHIVLATLGAAGPELPRADLASVPHTTAALSDRGTAFDEGFAIHLETWDAHFSTDPAMRARYRHERFNFGPAEQKRSEYFRHAIDLMSYSQNLARYYEVRENNYAFAPAWKGPDYLRVQLEKGRDFATLRDANQLLQSEGFYASFFFSCLVRGPQPPEAATLRQRHEQMLAVLAEMFRAYPLEKDAPHLLHFVESYLRLYPNEAGEIVDVLLDLSHGVFVDADAAALWQELYLGALRLDLKQLPFDRIQAQRARWREAILKDPQILYSRLGPQIRCLVPARKVQLVALGGEQPLKFDVNTVPEGILRMIPGLSESELDRWQTERAKTPFANVDDFKSRVALSEAVLEQLRFQARVLTWVSSPPGRGR
jgi:hypothetical protein